MFEDIDEFFDAVPLGRKEEVIRTTNNGGLELFYAKLADLGYNLDELKDILECDDTMLVLSGAGSGKTTALILKIIRDMVAGNTLKLVDCGANQVMVQSNILVCTYLKSGAEELREAFSTWCKRLNIEGVDYSSVKFKTIHAEVYDVLKQLGVNVDILENTSSIIRDTMNAFSVRSVQSVSRSLTVEEVSDMSCIFTYCRNRLDSKKYEHSLMGEFALNALKLDLMLSDFKTRRAVTGKLDYEDLQELLLEGLKINPDVRRFVANRYDYVYVDEFQDTSQLQYELFKYYFENKKRVIAIGDDDQTIYSWRGSDIEIITKKFEEDYTPVVKHLTMNYRCAANILQAVLPSIEKNKNRHSKKIRACNPDGQLLIVEDLSPEVLLSSVKEDLQNQYKVGVLARTNAELLPPAILLELDGGLEYELSKSVNMDTRMSKQIVGLMGLITKRYSEEFEGYFKTILPKYSHSEAKKLSDILKLNNGVSIFDIPERDLQYSVPNLAKFLFGLSRACSKDKVTGYLYILGYLGNSVYISDSPYAKKANDFTKFIYKLIVEHPKLSGMDIFSLDRLFNSVLPNKLSKRASYGKGRIKLSTVHDAKGKEWDSVYIWNNITGSFPNQVGSREMTHLEIEEERRLHYIAWTRAKKKLTVYTHKNMWGDFLKECDLSFAKEVVENTDKSKLVFTKKRVRTPIEEASELVSKYILSCTDRGNLSDPVVSNVEMVLSEWGRDWVIDFALSSVGILDYPDDEKPQRLEDMFEELMDVLMESKVCD